MDSLSASLSVRPATPEDEPFLRELFFDIRSPEFAPPGLPADQLQALLAQQYEMRRIYYGSVWPDAVYRILELDGRAIGYDLLDEGEELHLIDIAISPPFQNRGLGTARMQEHLALAAARGTSLVLSVELFNPARHLYERLGFVQFENQGMYQRMRWTPKPSA